MTTDLRDNKIENVLEYDGLSVIIRNEQEYNCIKRFLGEDVLYIDYVPKMSEIETGVVIWATADGYSTGSVGMSERHRKSFIRTVEFSDFFSV